jgi:4-hydroxy-tetrahydrodipicolinate reductase
MAIRVCVAGATGWTGSAVTDAILGSSDFQLVGAIARRPFFIHRRPVDAD